MSLDLNSSDFLAQPFSDDELKGLGDFTPIPNGRYHVRLINVSDVTANNSGNTGKEFQFELLAGPFANRKVRDTLWSTYREKAEQIHRFYAARLGVMKHDGTNYVRDPNVSDWSDLIGRTYIIEIQQEKYTDKHGVEKMGNRVKLFGIHRLDDEKARQGVVFAEGTVLPMAPASHAGGNGQPALAGAGAGVNGSAGKRDDYSDL